MPLKDINKLLSLSDIEKLDIDEVRDLYKKYVNPGIEKIFSSFSIGMDLFDKADGMYIYTRDGKKILDLTGGIGVLNHGHNDEKILKARIKYQNEKRMEVHKLVFSPYIAGLSYNISKLLPNGLNKVFFCNSGAEANEGALKVAHRYHKGKKKYVLHSENGFHGKLIATGSISGKYAKNFNFPFFNFGKTFKTNDLSSLNKLYNQGEFENVFAIIIELYSASTLEPVDETFIRKIREICNKLNIILIFDEVYTGWGKTGYLFNFQRFKDIVPDIITMSKSLGGGKASISAYVVSDKTFKSVYEKEKDAFIHSTTYNGFGEECLTAIESINIVVGEDFPAKAKKIEHEIIKNFNILKEKYPNIIKNIKGTGGLHGIFFHDQFKLIQSLIKNINISFINDNKVFISKIFLAALIEKLYSKHKILALMGETSLSSSDNTKEFAYLDLKPSLIIKKEEIEYFFKSLDNVLSEGINKLNLDFLKKVFKSKIGIN